MTDTLLNEGNIVVQLEERLQIAPFTDNFGETQG